MKKQAIKKGKKKTTTKGGSEKFKAFLASKKAAKEAAAKMVPLKQKAAASTNVEDTIEKIKSQVKEWNTLLNKTKKSR